MKNMTKKEALIIALTTMTNDEARAIIEKMIAQLEKPRAKSDKPTKLQVENAELSVKVLEFMNDKDWMSTKEIAEAFDVSVQKMSNILTSLSAEGKVKDEERKIENVKGKRKCWKMEEV